MSNAIVREGRRIPVKLVQSKKQSLADSNRKNSLKVLSINRDRVKRFATPRHSFFLSNTPSINDQILPIHRKMAESISLEVEKVLYMLI